MRKTIGILLLALGFTFLSACKKDAITVSVDENDYTVETIELKDAVSYPFPKCDGGRITYLSKRDGEIFFNSVTFADGSLEKIKLPFTEGMNMMAFEKGPEGDIFFVVSIKEKDGNDYFPHLIKLDGEGNTIYDRIYDKETGYFPVANLFFENDVLCIGNGENCCEISDGEILKETEKTYWSEDRYPPMNLDNPDYDSIENWAFYDAQKDVYNALMYRGSMMYAGIIKRSETDSYGGVPQLVIASYSPTSTLYQVVSEFNRSQKVVHAVVRKYEGGDIETAVAKLSADMINGEQIDLVDLFPSYDRSDMVEKGFYENLSGYIEKSSDINENDYIQAAWNLGRVNDVQYGIPVVFSIQTMSSKPEYVTSELTPQAFMEIVRNNPGKRILYEESGINYLNACLSFSLNEYINESGQVDFDKDSFKDTLLFCKEMGSISHDMEEAPLFEELFFSGPESFAEEIYECGGSGFTITGYPSVPGGFGTFLTEGSGMLAISSRSAMKEEAFDFVTYFVKSLSAQEHVMFQTDRELFIRQVESSLEEMNHHTGANADVKAYAKQLLDVVDSAVTSYGCDEQVAQIIFEEAEAFFKGASGVDETVDKITKRTDLYLMEKKD